MGFPTDAEVLAARVKLRDLNLENWLHQDLRQWTWWLDVAAIILFLALWWWLVDRRRMRDILIYGLLVAMAATFLDVLGTDLVLWDYPDTFLPMGPRIIIFDYVAMPVAYMLIYQYFPKWKTFLLANAALAALFTFAVEPLLVRLNLYKLVHWEYAYSLPFYVLVAAAARWLGELLAAQQDRPPRR